MTNSAEIAVSLTMLKKFKEECDALYGKKDIFWIIPDTVYDSDGNVRYEKPDGVVATTMAEIEEQFNAGKLCLCKVNINQLDESDESVYFDYVGAPVLQVTYINNDDDNKLIHMSSMPLMIPGNGSVDFTTME